MLQADLKAGSMDQAANLKKVFACFGLSELKHHLSFHTNSPTLESVDCRHEKWQKELLEVLNNEYYAGDYSYLWCGGVMVSSTDQVRCHKSGAP